MNNNKNPSKKDTKKASKGKSTSKAKSRASETGPPSKQKSTKEKAVKKNTKPISVISIEPVSTAPAADPKAQGEESGEPTPLAAEEVKEAPTPPPETKQDTWVIDSEPPTASQVAAAEDLPEKQISQESLDPGVVKSFFVAGGIDSEATESIFEQRTSELGPPESSPQSQEPQTKSNSEQTPQGEDPVIDNQLWEEQKILEEQKLEPEREVQQDRALPADTEMEAERQMEEIIQEQFHNDQPEESQPLDFYQGKAPSDGGSPDHFSRIQSGEQEVLRNSEHESPIVEDARVIGGDKIPLADNSDEEGTQLPIPEKLKQHDDREEHAHEEPAEEEPGTPDKDDLEIGEHETRGANLNKIQQGEDDIRTEKIVGGDGTNNFFSDVHEDNFTEFGITRKPPPEEIKEEEMGFMDEEELQPKNTLDFTEEQHQEVIESWLEVKKKGYMSFGKQVMWNLFNFQPATMKLYSFKDEEEVYKSAAFKRHSTKLATSLDNAISLLGETSHMTNFLKALGMRHCGYDVKKEHYNVIGKSIMATLEDRLGDELQPSTRASWISFLKTMQASMISDNYEQEEEDPSPVQQKRSSQAMQSSNHISDNTRPTKDESLQVKQKESQISKVSKGPKTLGETSEALSIAPSERASQRPSERPSEQASEDTEFRVSDRILFKVQTSEEKDYHMTVEKKTIVVRTWTRIMKDESMGAKLYMNLFDLAPETLKLFPFRNVKNLMESYQLKTHGNKILGLFGNVVKHMNDLDLVTPSLSKFGEQHIAWHVSDQMFEMIALAAMKTFRTFLGDDYTLDTHFAYRVFFNIIIEIMLEKWERKSYMDRIQVDKSVLENRRSTLGLGLANMLSAANMKSKPGAATQYDNNTVASFSTRNLHSKNVVPSVKRVDSEESIHHEVRQHLLQRMRNEVDFHHKICFRFEKAYRLNKEGKIPQRKLNLELIDCISEYSVYIGEDPMSVFYCLFFCIFYNNLEMVDFLRQLVQRLPTMPKVDRLLEMIDTYGVGKLRNSSEQINSLVYHLVFYQAVDDDLRVVYSQIFRYLKFIQLRDKDAIHLLNSRDYELIQHAFEKHTTKINLLQFYSKAFPLKSSTYRRYNQAYFEEIVINNEIEPRVAMNYRERFLVTPEDIYIVFEMYCKEDYFEQFKKTKKDSISHKQFVDLFVICLRHDSFRIAILIYTLYLNPSVDMDKRIMNILISTIRESIKFHEMKQFFLHEHFDTLSISQLNKLVDIYQEVLSRKEPNENPMISQFNTIKLTLLIYRICWKIEEKQIYSLITKCSLLKAYLINSLSYYLEQQNNVLTLYHYIREPILHMTERKDSLDIMYEMNMQELLHHPVVVEVLNFVAEGKYSVSSSALSMVSTFNCLLDMDMLNQKSVVERLVANITNFGDIHNGKQSSLQFNIWKQSIQQRERDEMIFTVLINLGTLILASALTLMHNDSYSAMQETFGPHFFKRKGMFLGASGYEIEQFCEEEIDSINNEAPILRLFTIFVMVSSFGGLVSFVQKLLIIKFKDNVRMSIGHIILQLSMALSGVLYVITYYADKNSMISDTCSKYIDMSGVDIDTVDHISTMRDPTNATGLLKFKIVLSVQIIEASISMILMLKRTHQLGELIMMLQIMAEELIRFFSTFGIIILLLILVGRTIGTELKEGGATFYELSLDIFDAFNGNHEFQDYLFPNGQLYIGVIMYTFKVLLLSLLAAMFINKYDQVYFNLDAIRRFNIIRQKNCIAYDKQVGGATITFFPINIIIGPFLVFIFLAKNSRASEFALRFQYFIMVLLYGFVLCILLIPSIPILYIKSVVNAGYIMVFRKRQDYKFQKLKQFLVAVFLGMPIILVSVVIDYFCLPGTMLKPSSQFEHKYQLSEHKMSAYQVVTVNKTLNMIYAGYEARFKNQSMTLHQLMMMHIRIFKIIENLHDFTCKGLKDYKEALSNVQDYNVTKVLSEKCSIPDKSGEYKEGRCFIDQIYFIAQDLSLYNYVDVVLRRLRLGSLESCMRQAEEKNVLAEQEEEKGFSKTKREALQKAKIKKQEAALKQKRLDNEDDDEDEVEEGITPNEVGPDGVILWRNKSDVMNNFFIDIVSRAFTDITKEANSYRARNEKIRAKKIETDITRHQKGWREMTQGVYFGQAEKVQREIKNQLKYLKDRGMFNKINRQHQQKNQIQSVVREEDEDEGAASEEVLAKDSDDHDRIDLRSI